MAAIIHVHVASSRIQRPAWCMVQWFQDSKTCLVHGTVVCMSIISEVRVHGVQVGAIMQSVACKEQLQAKTGRPWH